jgi:hypothetical protein
MKNVLIDRRDQMFVLYEMLNAERIISARSYSRDQFDMTLRAAYDLAIHEVYPALRAGKKNAIWRN